MEKITLSISLYCLALSGRNPIFSNGEMERLLNVVNHIWAQAGIYFERDVIDNRHPPFPPFVDWREYAFRTGVDFLPSEGFSIVGIFTTGFQRPNGFSRPQIAPVFVVKDYPNLCPVPFETEFSIDENDKVARVCSHEIGHILGLDHFDNPKEQRDRLMFSASRGTRLTSDEINRTREKAQKYISPTSS